MSGLSKRRHVATRYWKVEISQLGVAEPLFVGTVAAPSWPLALQEGRTDFGESGGVPAGASCNVATNGLVTIQDGREQRRYRITPTEKPKSAAPAPPPPSVPPPLPSAAELASAPKPSSPPPDSVEGKMILLASREERPNTASPIHFRERMYAVPAEFQAGTGEKLATKILRTVQDEMAEEQGPRFIRIELFDHIWRDKPERASVVRLEWKDWKPSIEIDFPLEEETRQSEAPKQSSAPAPPTEDRLAYAFEACHDLLFMKNRAEALEFAVHLLEELIPSEAAAAFLLDVNTDEFRVVAARGTGARVRQTRAYPSTGGLLGAASALAEHAVLVLADAAADPRYDENIDGVPGMDVRSLLYRPLIHRGRLFGLIQLANGLTDGMFTEADCEVVDYVTQQLSTFVAQGTSRTNMQALSR